MGGSTPQQPTPPTVGSNIAEYVANYPKLVQLQGQYGPQEAAQQVALAQQYAGPLGQAYKTAQDQIYPNETALSNALTQQAQAGIQSDVPDWMKQEYLSGMRAQLGENAMSGIGADYVSRGLMQQKQDWQNYYRNMGLSIAGRQPVYSANSPQTNQITQGFTPQGVMGYNQGIYGQQMNAWGQQQAQGNQWMNAGAGILGSIGGGIGGGWANNFFK
jgi:hypothetical protein